MGVLREPHSRISLASCLGSEDSLLVGDFDCHLLAGEG